MILFWSSCRYRKTSYIVTSIFFVVIFLQISIENIPQELYNNSVMDYLVAGLGNPGDRYENTRHNVGWILLGKIAEKYNVKIKKIKFKSTYAETEIAEKKILLLKPQTYMNRSGEAVLSAAEYYQIPPENIIIICDDIALPFGKIRIRRKGSSGGQKGLENIIYLLENDQFPRIRIGVSKTPDDMETADWVLSNFSSQERKTIEGLAEPVCDALRLIIEKDIDAAMAKYN